MADELTVQARGAYTDKPPPLLVTELADAGPAPRRPRWTLTLENDVAYRIEPVNLSIPVRDAALADASAGTRATVSAALDGTPIRLWPSRGSARGRRRRTSRHVLRARGCSADVACSDA